jgi:hypothetical protein
MEESACDDKSYLVQYQWGVAVPHILYCECQCPQRPNVSLVDATALGDEDDVDRWRDYILENLDEY